MENQRGMSIIKLIIVVGVLIGLSFAMYMYFNKLATKSKQTDITTNMYTLNTNATEILNSNIHKNEQLVGTRIEPDEKYNLTQDEMVYQLDEKTLENMGLYVDSSNYLIIYDVTNKKTDVIYTQGIKTQDSILYRLSQIENMEKEQEEQIEQVEQEEDIQNEEGEILDE